jgi:hypothetical protein
MEVAAVVDLDDKGSLLRPAPDHFDATNPANLPQIPAQKLRASLEGVAKKGLPSVSKVKKKKRGFIFHVSEFLWISLDSLTRFFPSPPLFFLLFWI